MSDQAKLPEEIEQAIDNHVDAVACDANEYGELRKVYPNPVATLDALRAAIVQAIADEREALKVALLKELKPSDTIRNSRLSAAFEDAEHCDHFVRHIDTFASGADWQRERVLEVLRARGHDSGGGR